MPSKTFLSLAILLQCACTYGQHISLTPGATFTYRFINQQSQKYIPEKTISFRFEVLGKDDNGYYRVKCTPTGFVINDLYTPGKQYDSRYPSELPLTSSNELMDLALLYQPFELLVNNKGYVARYIHITEPIARKADEWVLNPQTKSMLLSNANYYVNPHVQLIFPPLPDNPAGWQLGWLNADSTIKYRVSKREGDLLHIAYTGITRNADSIKYRITQEGELQYDLKTGKVISVAQKTVSSGETKGLDGKNIPSDWSESLSATLQPDTLQAMVRLDKDIDLAVKMCYSSNALRDGPVYDSAKTYAFFTANDSANMHNKSYLLRKLGIMQGVRAANNYELYQTALSATPNAWLEGQYIHLHNKLQQAVTENIDSAYALIGYLSKSASYSDWIQHSFSQAFIEQPSFEKEVTDDMKKEGYSDEKIAREIEKFHRHMKISRELINRLSQDADTSIRNSAYPLSLWVAAKAHSSDTSLQSSLVSQMEQLSPSQAKQGNAARYALLLYKQLQASGQKAMAEGLLEHTIAGLEIETADETTKDRFLARNMLAYAWKLKYEAVKATDPQEALACLSKAAAFSPKNPSEMAYGSFYDRVFLQSKESYRADFAKALIAAGDKKQALKTLAEQVQADPTIVGELKKSFETNFPGKDFGDFFNEVITRSWKTAPDFSLKSIDGRSYRLADYKGKWLVLDFWGTWCAPCREEMPDNNAFAKRIQVRPEIAFLAIACNNNITEVKEYFAANQFDMPAAMADNTIEKKYEVPGYPAKFIVSPDGRMLPLKFGADWKGIVEQFSTLAKPTKKSPVDSKPVLKNAMN